MTGSRLLVAALLLSPAAPAGAAADPPNEAPNEAPGPMIVTSDTDAYCQTLSRQLDRPGVPLPQPVALLRAQGRQLCAQGQVRGGINRLRRALVALHGNDADAPYQDGPDDDGDRP